jgi:hypothetical protein
MRNVTAAKPKSSASETITLILPLKVTDSEYATTDLTVRTEARDNASVVG